MTHAIVPSKLVPLIKAFSADEKTAKLLITEAAEAIICSLETNSNSTQNEISREEMEGILGMMKGIAPIDTLEMIYGAQIIYSHLMGLRFLSHSFAADQLLGLKLLKFSNEAMECLYKKRSGHF